MPLYYFHLSFGDRTVPDDEGVELPNRIPAHAHRPSCARDRDAGYRRASRRTARVDAHPAGHDGRRQRTTLTLTASQIRRPGVLPPHLVVVLGR